MAIRNINIKFDASMDISKIKNSVAEMQKSLSNVKFSQVNNKKFLGYIANLEKEIDDFNLKANKEITSMADFRALEKSAEKVINAYQKIQIEAKSLSSLTGMDFLKAFSKDSVNNIEKANNALKEYYNETKGTTESIAKQKKALTDLEKAYASTSKEIDELNSKNKVSDATYKEYTKDRKDAKSRLTEAQNTLATVGAEYDTALTDQSRLNKKGQLDKRQGQNKDLLKRLEEAKTAFENAQVEFNTYDSKLQSAIGATAYNKKLKELQTTLQQKETAVNEAKTALQELEKVGTSGAFDKLKKTLSDITGQDYSGIQNTADGVEKLQNEIRKIESNEIEELRREMNQFETTVDNTDDAIRGAKTTLNEFGNTVVDIERTTKDIDNLKNSMLAFFSISNTIEIFKRTIREAYQTVTELDKAMTETAVVTDFSVGDMWEALPRYTEAANKLGTTTLGAYETMTLFYQQGLKTNEVFEIGTETMKMARIAGMDYTKATDLMTAALRGFNMELNEVSARRINDVYSELAAITAADTEEIADAMTRTASIANSAGMEFETTSAFLSQMIETTREAPENLGTAMKTIIARFQELKKSPGEIAEVDGEIIDANKIDTALKTIGVSLMDTNGQFRELDDVFLEIAERWDTLDKNTQRYIATTAAGSRQQSRFIAMMSNYERTMELVEAANDSAGASQRQFEKTTESLESKINKLHNAWDEFTVGIANSAILKGGVDLLTTFLNTVNNLTGSIGSFTGSASRIIAVFAALKVGKNLFQSFASAGAQIKDGLGEAIEKGNLKQFIGSAFNKEFKGSKIDFSQLFSGNDSAYKNKLNQFARKYSKDYVKAMENAFKQANPNLNLDENLKRELQEIQIALRKGEIDAETAVKRFNSKIKQVAQVDIDTSKLQGELAEVQKVLTLGSKGFTLGQLQGISMAAMAAGGALMTLSEKAGSAESAVLGLGQSIMTAGSTFTMGSTLFDSLGLTKFIPQLGIASIALGVLSGAVTALERRKEKAIEIAEEEIAVGKESISNYKEQADALNNYDEAYQSVSKFGGERDNLLEATTNLVEAYELEGIAVKELTTDYANLTAQIRAAMKEKLLEEQSSIHTARVAAETKFKEKTTNILGFDKDYSFTEYTSDNASQVISQNDFSYITSEEKGTNAGGRRIALNLEDIDTYEEYAKLYEELSTFSKELEENLEGADESTKETYKTVKTWLSDLGPLVEEYKEIAEEEMAITISIKQIDLAEEGFDKNDVTTYEKYIEYRTKLQEELPEVSEEELSSFLRNDNVTSEFERNYGQVQKIVDKFAGDKAEIEKYLNSLARNGMLAYTFSLEIDDETIYNSLEDFKTELNEVAKEQQFSVAETLTSSTSDILNALQSEEGLAGLDTTQLQEFTSILGRVPGLYDDSRTAYQEWIDLTTSGAGLFEQASYLSDLLQRSNEILTGVPDTIDAINNAYKDANVTIEGSAERVDRLVQFTDSLIAQSEIASKAVGLISKNYTIDPENLEVILNTFPQLAENAQVLADGTVKLNQEVAKAVLGDMNAIVAGDGEKTKAILDNEIALAQAKLDQATNTLEAAQAAAGNEVEMQKVIAGANIDAQMAIAEALYGTEAVAAVTGAEIQNSEIGVAEEAENTGLSIGDNISAGAENAATNVNTFARTMVQDLYAVAQAGENAQKAIAGEGKAVNYAGNVNTGIGSYKKTETVVETREYRDIQELEASVVKDDEEKIFDFSGLKDITDQEWAAVINQLENNKTQAEETLADLILAKSKIVSSIDGIELGSGLDKASKEAEKWVNPYDKLYNLVRKINKALRMREKYERQYQRAVEDSGKSTADLLKNLNKQENKLNQIIQKEKTLIKKRKAEATSAEKSTIFGKTKYSYYATYDDKNNIVNINWDRINKVKNEETGKKIEDYIKKLEEIQDEVEGANDTIEDSNDILKELELEGREEYLDLEQRVFDAIVKKQQDQIDALSQIDESINDANQSLIDSIQNSLSKQRQERDNERKEEEIAEKERRLSYLRRDTSNANNKEIRQLEEEIANAKEDYTDSLIDQKISELQEQNDAAAEQRQQQIELLQGQLDADVKNGVYWEEVKALIENGTTIAGGLLKGSELEELLQSAEGWQGMSETQRTVWVEDLMETIKQALAWKEREEGTNPLATPQKGMSLEEMMANGFISVGQNVGVNTDTAGTIVGKAQKGGTVYNEGKAGDGVTFTYSGLTWTGEKDSSGRYIFDKNATNRYEKPKSSSGSTSGKNNGGTTSGGNKVNQNTSTNVNANYKSGEDVKKLQRLLKQYFGWSGTVDGIYGSNTTAGVKAMQSVIGATPDGLYGESTKTKLTTYANKHLIKSQYGAESWFNTYLPNRIYKTGGIADFTGPAWLDGTKSKPELVLNAKDTENFIQLKNILSQILSGASSTTTANSGDSYYEIHIEVDELNNDYDVEQLASKVKRMINEDARYRNVNAISLLR